MFRGEPCSGIRFTAVDPDLRVTLPWLVHEYNEVKALMGDDYWLYGFGANARQFEAFTRYHPVSRICRRRRWRPGIFSCPRPSIYRKPLDKSPCACDYFRCWSEAFGLCLLPLRVARRTMPRRNFRNKPIRILVGQSVGGGNNVSQNVRMAANGGDKMKIAHNVLGLFLALALVGASGESTAQSYPNKPIRLVVGLPPGGGTDILARLIGQKLVEQVGQQVIVENRPGADALIATEYVAKSAPDGYTLLVGTNSGMVLNPSLYPVPYDVVKDFIPITVFGPAPVVFAVHPSFPGTSVKDLIALARAKPGELHYSTGGTVFQVAGELIKQQAGVNITHVPYKGSNPAVNAALAGDVPMVATSIAAVLPHLRAGKLRALAVTSTKRSPVLPDVPTVAESGLANYEYMLWTGLFAPAGTPRAIIDKLYSEMSIALKSDSLRERFAGLSYETSGMVGMPPAEFGAMHRAELAKWTKLIKDLNIRAE